MCLLSPTLASKPSKKPTSSFILPTTSSAQEIRHYAPRYILSPTLATPHPICSLPISISAISRPPHSTATATATSTTTTTTKHSITLPHFTAPTITTSPLPPLWSDVVYPSQQHHFIPHEDAYAYGYVDGTETWGRGSTSRKSFAWDIETMRRDRERKEENEREIDRNREYKNAEEIAKLKKEMEVQIKGREEVVVNERVKAAWEEGVREGELKSRMAVGGYVVDGAAAGRGAGNRKFVFHHHDCPGSGGWRGERERLRGGFLCGGAHETAWCIPEQERRKSSVGDAAKRIVDQVKNWEVCRQMHADLDREGEGGWRRDGRRFGRRCS